MARLLDQDGEPGELAERAPVGGDGIDGEQTNQSLDQPRQPLLALRLGHVHRLLLCRAA